MPAPDAKPDATNTDPPPRGRRGISHLTAPERRLRAQVAAQASWATKTPEQRRSRTENAIRARCEKLVNEVDPGHRLSEDVRERMGADLYRLEMTRLAFRSMKARRLKREAEQARQAEARARREES